MPSPPSSTFTIGPVSGHWYGLLIGIAALLFTVVTALCWRRRGGDWERAVWLCLAALPAALIGARLYHLATGGSFGPEQGVAVWAGGLGIYGAVAGGAVVLAGGAWLLGLDPLRFLDCATPGLALAQAVGRLGNWFNQELYGRPTDLPWGLEIDPAHRLPGPRAVQPVPAHLRLRGPVGPGPGGHPLARRRRASHALGGACRSGSGWPATGWGGSGSRASGPSTRSTWDRCASTRSSRWSQWLRASSSSPMPPGGRPPPDPYRRKTGTRRFSASSSMRATTST